MAWLGPSCAAVRSIGGQSKVTLVRGRVPACGRLRRAWHIQGWGGRFGVDSLCSAPVFRGAVAAARRVTDRERRLDRHRVIVHAGRLRPVRGRAGVASAASCRGLRPRRPCKDMPLSTAAMPAEDATASSAAVAAGAPGRAARAFGGRPRRAGVEGAGGRTILGVRAMCAFLCEIEPGSRPRRAGEQRRCASTRNGEPSRRWPGLTLATCRQGVDPEFLADVRELHRVGQALVGHHRPQCSEAGAGEHQPRQPRCVVQPHQVVPQ